jgi:outer membrane protein
MRYKVKKLSLLFFLVFAASATFAQTQAQPTVQKIGYVDSGVIMQSFKEAVKASSDLEALRIRYGKQLDSMSTALKAEYADFQKKAGAMKEAARTEAQQKFVAKDNALTQFSQEKQTELNTKREQMLAPIKEKVFKAIEEVAKTESLNFVFDKYGDAVLLFADSSTDITYKVLDKLKSGK